MGGNSRGFRRKKLGRIQKYSSYKYKNASISTADVKAGEQCVNSTKHDSEDSSVTVVEHSQDDAKEESLWMLAWLAERDHGGSSRHQCDTELTDSDGFKADEFFVVLDKVYRYDHSENLDEFVRNKSGQLYVQLKKRCVNGNQHLQTGMAIMPSSKFIRYIQIYDSETPTIRLSVTVLEDLTAEVAVHGKVLRKDHELWDGLPAFYTSPSAINELLDKLSNYNVCIGNPDDELQTMVPSWCSLEPNTLSGYRECDYDATFGNLQYNSTIRSKKCALLTGSARCKNCGVYRRTLKKKETRSLSKVPAHEKNWVTSTFPNSRLSPAELQEKIVQLRQYSTNLESTVASLQRKLNNNDSAQTGMGGQLKDRTVCVSSLRRNLNNSVSTQTGGGQLIERTVSSLRSKLSNSVATQTIDTELNERVSENFTERGSQVPFGQHVGFSTNPALYYQYYHNNYMMNWGAFASNGLTKRPHSGEGAIDLTLLPKRGRNSEN